MLNPKNCWAAVQQHDASQDGRFYYGVLTTGVFCRPSCPSRQPLEKNVRFYESPADAERDGLRACLRCRPLAVAGNDPNTARIGEISRYIETNADVPLRLIDLAQKAGLSPFHFQRSFKAIVGVSPKHYLEALRVKKLKTSLRHSTGIAEAVYDAGFGSSSRVYESGDTRLGMTPNQYRREGRGVTITYATVDSPVGLMMIGATDRGICFVQFGSSRSELLAALRNEYAQAELTPMREPVHPDFQRWIGSLTNYLAGRQPHLDLPLDIRATAFQMRVWTYLQSIPYGEVQSYGEVAAGIGNPKAVRAVASACAANNVALVIPCHRVIRGTGEMGGYRWGLPRKRTLIDMERASARQK
jgi:AraC family transcriptional regulator, regulatory protein of adaptative response / methylated-DNA-[protein]-cysteine methyltransferase